MQLCSTNNKNIRISFKDAVLKGIADDGGLFMPLSIPMLPKDYFIDFTEKAFIEIAYDISKKLLNDEIPINDLMKIINESLTFEVPLVQLDDSNFVLELFHGPTLAFKDFGARFLAKVLDYFRDDKEITILVATSGDTGSAVANGFYNIEGFKVVLLYPSGKVSKIQEQQLTTLGNNVSVLEVDGNFDDCQRLVKQAFTDKQLSKELRLSSANSINIARLVPQSFYYFYAYAQLKKMYKNSNAEIVFSVPSGNFGNLTAGVIAYKMGLPVKNFVASVNANDIFPSYLISGEYVAKPSINTLSNAMDVGDPSNFARLSNLFDHDYLKIKSLIKSYSFSDEENKEAIIKVYKENKYIIDPHGAIGYLGLQKYLDENVEKSVGIILETAHPAKFKEVVDNVLNIDVSLPEELANCMKKEKHSTIISNKFEDLRDFLKVS